ATTAACENDSLQFLGGGRAHPHTDAFVSEDLQCLDVVVGLAGHHRVHAARVVADHAAECAATVCRRVRSEGKVMLFSSIAQVIEDHSGLNACEPALRIDLENLIEILGEIENYGSIATLASKRCAATAGQNRRSELATGGYCRDDILSRAR